MYRPPASPPTPPDTSNLVPSLYGKVESVGSRDVGGLGGRMAKGSSSSKMQHVRTKLRTLPGRKRKVFLQEKVG